MVKKILVDEKGKRYAWTSGDFHSTLGKVPEKDIKTCKEGKVRSHLGKEFKVFNAQRADERAKMTRSAATAHVKDIGHIVAVTGVNKKSVVVDAGTGTGFLAACLADLAGEVTTYEKNKTFYENAKKNFEKLGLKITCKHEDITEGIKEKNVDIITLDFREPWKVFPHAEKALVSGGFLVMYVPQITQVLHIVKDMENYHFVQEKIIEISEREWVVDTQRARPVHNTLGHTAFLVFLRRY